MITFHFNPRCELIILNVGLEYRYRHSIRMALDTASSFSVITPGTATRLGFDLARIRQRQAIATASQTLVVPRVTVPKTTLHTESVSSVRFLCMPLPLPLRVEGLLGLNFLRHFKITLDFEAGLLTLDPIGR